MIDKKMDGIFVWMTLLGFDRDKKDKGVGELINRMGFVPKGVSLLLFHPDIVHLHEGMEEEKILPPDNCSYYAIPYNDERCRQAWSNYDLKTLIDELKLAGVEPYLGIMGSNLENKFHDEWGNEHPETKFFARTKKSELNVLKRFIDGTYYEDFFVDKLCKVLIDYGFKGVHVTDNFCPQNGTMHDGDFSVDMLGQFAEHTCINFPDEIVSGFSNDDYEEINRRGDWIWNNCRQEWIEFHAWRWEVFWKKICSSLHGIEKKVIVLGTYCTAPFETLYCLGIDLRRLVDAGVDYLMPNPAAGSAIVNETRRFRFYQYMLMAPLISAYATNANSLCMLGVKDSAEEWDHIHYTPSFVERTINTLTGYFINKEDGLKRCIKGFMICLGDGISREEWKWLGERFEVSFSENSPKKILLPTLVWSDEGFKNLLPAYIKSRRWTVHKFVYELARLGVFTGAVLRSENINLAEGPLFVPNFDLLSESEKQDIANYSKGSVVCTASTENGFNPQSYGIEADIYFEDLFSEYKLCAFAFNVKIHDKDSILNNLKLDEVSDDINEPFETEESTYTLTNTLPFTKVSTGFVKACASLIQYTNDGILSSKTPIMQMLLHDGRIRVYVMNENRFSFVRATITSKKAIKEVINVTKFPVLPVKYIDDPNEQVGCVAKFKSDKSFSFVARLAPGGLSIFDVILEETLIDS